MESLLLADKLSFVTEGSSGENTAYRLAMDWQTLAGVLSHCELVAGNLVLDSRKWLIIQ